MSPAIATSVVVRIPGVPPNWSQWRGSSIRRDVAKAEWRDLAWMLAMSARNEARWPPPVRCQPAARRFLAIRVHKLLPFYDDDGCLAALKPLVDGACGRTVLPGGTRDGVLAWDDSPAWLGLITRPMDMQHEVESVAEECVVLTVHLARPA